MSDLPKYMLLTHPTMDGQQFILRTKPPLVVGQIIHGDIDNLIRELNPVAYGRPYGQNEVAVFYVGQLVSYEFIGTTQEQADYLAKIMRKMSDFYLYLNP